MTSATCGCTPTRTLAGLGAGGQRARLHRRLGHRVPARQVRPRLDRGQIVDVERFAGLTAHDTHREVYGAERRVVLTHSLTHPAPSPVPRVRPDPGQSERETLRAGRHPRPRKDPPHQGETRHRNRPDPARPLGAARHHLGTDRPEPTAAPAELPHRRTCPRRPGSRHLRQKRADHRPQRSGRSPR